MINLLLSIWSWIFLILFTVLDFLIGLLITSPLSLIVGDRTRYLTHRVAVLWAKSTLAVTPFWRLKVIGKKNVQPGRHYVLVCNHHSMLDILIALAGLPVHFKFMAKEELFRVPFIGWHMALAGYIPIKRGNAQSGRQALDIARQWLEKNVSVLFFPEGTRSLDGEIKNFKAGAFKLAQEIKMEILPVVIEGTGDALPRKSLVLQKRTDMFLSIGQPVRISPKEDLDAAMERIRGEMRGRLARLRRR